MAFAGEFTPVLAKHSRRCGSDIAHLLSLRKLCTAIKCVVMDGFRAFAELHHGLCDLIVECYTNWYRCKARLAKLRAR